VEVGEAVFSLYVFANEAELAEGDFVVLKVGQGDFVDATLETEKDDVGNPRE
jgi:hypothetical protein